MTTLNRFTRAALAAAVALALSAPAWSNSYKQPPSQVLSSAPGQALGHVGSGSRAAAVATALGNRGASAATAQSIVEVSSGASKFNRTHVKLEQQVGGLSVYGTSLKATIDRNGDLVSVVGRLAAIPSAAPKAATISERQALDAAMARVHPGAQVNFVPGPRSGQTMRFRDGTFLQSDAEVTRVAVPQADGSLAQGFLVETWTAAGNLLDHTLVGGDGTVLNVERRTANANYLTERLTGLPGIQTPAAPEWGDRVYFYYVVRLDRKVLGADMLSFAAALAAEGVYDLRYVSTTRWIIPQHLEPVFRDKVGYGGKGCPFECKYYDGHVEYGPGR